MSGYDPISLANRTRPVACPVQRCASWVLPYVLPVHLTRAHRWSLKKLTTYFEAKQDDKNPAPAGTDAGPDHAES